MSPEAQRRACAEAQGYRYARMGIWVHPEGFELYGAAESVLPRYLEDLNACDLLIRRMQSLGWDCVLIAEGGHRCCTFIRRANKVEVEVKVISTKFTTAICEAFLKAVGQWVFGSDRCEGCGGIIISRLCTCGKAHPWFNNNKTKQ